MNKRPTKSNVVEFRIENIKDSSKYFITLIGKETSLTPIEPSTYISIVENGISRNIRINGVHQKGDVLELELAKSDLKGINTHQLAGNSYPIRGALNLANTTYGFGVSWWMPFVILGVLGLMGLGLWFLKY